MTEGEWYRGVVPPAGEGASVAAFLRAHLGVSRRMLRRLKSRGEILVNGEPAKVRDHLRAGDELALVLPDLPSPNITPEEGPLTVIFEDEAIVVVDKPAGVLVHPVHGQEGGTLAQVVAHHLSLQGLSPKPRPVHRLDRDTSGVIVFAKSAHVQHRLALQFRRSEVSKEYLAVVRGSMADDQGTLAGWLARAPGRMVAVDEEPVDGKGLRAQTRFRVLERLSGGAITGGATVLLLEPRTGRTHQLRAQLSASGHPIIGDRLYGPADEGDAAIGRQALHASAIEFRHPFSDRPMRLGAPVPPDLARLIGALRGAT
ncbi:MAG TPA: RluA family pseudouridine synthase [Bacillota bacterium]|jgi:23S rRNA pseudouridine1911/1915/1917 synthase